MENTFLLYIILLIVILFLVMLAQRIKISYPIILVLGGLTLGFIPGLPIPEINPELIFLIFLPPLLYEAAWQTSWKDFWKWRRIIVTFAFGIVILTSCIIAFVSNAIIPGFTVALGFLLGAIISPPDAVSATSILKHVKVPKRLVTIIEGESLLNDASSLIILRFALTAVTSGKFVFYEAATSFFIVIILGTLTGIGIALVFYAIHRWLPTNASMDTVLSFIAPYIMYIAAEKLHFSGVLAVVSGGLFLSNKSHSILSHLSRMQGTNVWSTIGFAMNGIIFMLIGLQLPGIVERLSSTSLASAFKYSLIISLVLVVTRIICSLGASLFTMLLSKFITTADSSPGFRDPLIIGWAGMRGVVSLASALSIPLFLVDGSTFPQRDLILFITFIVIFITLVFQGLTLPTVVRWVNAKEKDYPVPADEQDLIVREKLIKSSLNFLNGKYEDELKKNELLQNLKLRLESDIKFLNNLNYSEESEKVQKNFGAKYREIFSELLTEQRQLLLAINKKAEVDEIVVRKHLAQIDLEEERLRHLVSKASKH